MQEIMSHRMGKLFMASRMFCLVEDQTSVLPILLLHLFTKFNSSCYVVFKWDFNILCLDVSVLLFVCYLKHWKNESINK